MLAELVGLVREAVRRIATSQLRPLEHHASCIRKELWKDLWSQAKRLVKKTGSFLGTPGLLDSAIAAHLRFNRDLADACVSLLERLGKQVAEASHTKGSAAQHLQIAFGVPGVLGCMNRQGDSVLCSPLLHSSTGLVAAFDALDLDIAGLPAARLPTGTRLPSGSGWQGVFRGGPSYASSAVVWRSKLSGLVSTLDAIGSDCRIWNAIAGSDGSVLHLGTMAFPTMGKHHNDAWVEQLEGLASDLRQLKTMNCAGALINVFSHHAYLLFQIQVWHVGRHGGSLWLSSA